jgi:hypothetical protein
MSATHAAHEEHPAPHRKRVSNVAAAFGLLGGPTGWFLQLAGGYALASEPCFVCDDPASSTMALLGGTRAAIAALSLVGLCLAATALWVSWRLLQRTQEEASGDHRYLLEVGSGRTRFLASWGVYLSAAFAIVTSLSFIALGWLPRCVD